MSNSKRVISIIKDVFTVLIFLIAIFFVAITIVGKKDEDGTVNIFGYQCRIVLSNSMEKSEVTDVSEYEIKDIPIKSMIFIKTIPEDEEKRQEFYANLKIGDVVTFKYVYVKQEVITHRIVDIEEKETGGYLIYLEGDNKTSDSNILKQVIDTTKDNGVNYIIGKVTGKSLFIGSVVTVLRSPVGIVLCIIVPCVILIVYEIIKLVLFFSKEKEMKKHEELMDKEKELEELKRKLELLENKKKGE